MCISGTAGDATDMERRLLFPLTSTLEEVHGANRCSGQVPPVGTECRSPAVSHNLRVSSNHTLKGTNVLWVALS